MKTYFTEYIFIKNISIFSVQYEFLTVKYKRIKISLN